MTSDDSVFTSPFPLGSPRRVGPGLRSTGPPPPPTPPLQQHPAFWKGAGEGDTTPLHTPHDLHIILYLCTSHTCTPHTNTHPSHTCTLTCSHTHLHTATHTLPYSTRRQPRKTTPVESNYSRASASADSTFSTRSSHCLWFHASFSLCSARRAGTNHHFSCVVHRTPSSPPRPLN